MGCAIVDGAAQARDLQSADARQHEIQNHKVKATCFSNCQAFAPTERDGHGVAVLRKPSRSNSAIRRSSSTTKIRIRDRNPCYNRDLNICCKPVGPDVVPTASMAPTRHSTLRKESGSVGHQRRDHHIPLLGDDRNFVLGV